MYYIPNGDHVVVHLLQLLLRSHQLVWGRVEFVCLETLIGELDWEWLLIVLHTNISACMR